MLFKEDTVARADAMAIRKGVGFYRWTHDLVEITGEDALDKAHKLSEWVRNLPKTSRLPIRHLTRQVRHLALI